ncbi:hypothetical protein HZS_1486 [Henneguya salminicola]|nr:hypothetical protein HZS_1486 [Henneguya salminicola]
MGILSESGGHTIIFATRRNLNYFPISSNVYFSVSFKTIHENFHQLFTFYGTNFITTIPCIWALMQRKQNQHMIQRINLNCSQAMCDFELVLINFFNQQNPHCELTGCLFPLSQCMERKIQEKCLSTLYVNDDLFQKNTKLFFSHAFFPSGCALSCLESFENYLIENCQIEQILKIFEYFENNFVGRLH